MALQNFDLNSYNSNASQDKTFMQCLISKLSIVIETFMVENECKYSQVAVHREPIVVHVNFDFFEKYNFSHFRLFNKVLESHVPLLKSQVCLLRMK